jgi:hypothetical protein
MIAFVGSQCGNAQAGSLDILYRSFRAGSECDPYVEEAFGPEFVCHPDGWGYGLYDGVSLHHFRSSLPAWQSEVALPPLKGKRIYAIFHSRLASDPTLNSPICSHPFIAATDREVRLLAHNGGVAVPEPSAALMVDSEWVLALIVKAGGIEMALPELKERTKPGSALNLLVMSIPRDEKIPPAIHGLNFYKADKPSQTEYYQMYIADFAGGKVFMSSTFKGLNLVGMTNIKPAPFGELLNFYV